MLDIKPPDYQYCPFCGTKLEIKESEERRKYCPKDNWTYYPRVATSAGAIIIKNKKILLVQRNREPYKGTWMYPSGFTEYGEHPEEAVRREVKEETGLNPTKVELIGIKQAIDDTREPGHLLFAYKVEVDFGKIKTDLEENQDIQWFDITKLPEIGWKVQKEFLKEIEILTNN